MQAALTKTSERNDSLRQELLSTYKVELGSLYKKIGQANIVQELRKFYEEKSTDHLSDKEFTRMMLLDGCFILYYIQFIYGEKAGNCRDLIRSHQIVIVQQDLFLLENQIPYKVLNEMMELIKLDRRDKFGSFFADNILAPGRQKKGWCGFGTCSTQNDQNSRRQLEGSIRFVADSLIHGLHFSLTSDSDEKRSANTSKQHKFRLTNYFNTLMERKGRNRNVIPEKEEISNRCTFRNVNELVDVGIRFKPSSVLSFAHIKFARRWWRFSADVKLPPITVDDSTKTILLNLIAYEMCSNDARSWVTSYICLLDSLIDHPEDVKALRKAGVLENSLGSDEEVTKLFNEIGTDLLPNNLAYSEAKNKIQRHYESLKNTWLSQLKHEYVKSPWSFLALLGAVMALFLTAVQTYFTVWSPKG
ncbi:hypothetical protein L2E82_01065 [Cichorium intybus]|uniref:Uncharacterized protein n=1 Tax=Cichorium intybus TaxID=13427 RepID=A0ACB9GXI0_CICIN|nr:hypothetical protein L2E82_01065 [Cichorium intybus]